MCKDSWSALKVYWVAQACSIILVTWETTVTRLKSAATTAFCLLHCLHRAASLACCISTTGCLRIKSHLVLLPVLSYPSISQIFQEKKFKKCFGNCCHHVPFSCSLPSCLILQQGFGEAAVWGECAKSSRWSPSLTGHTFLAEGLLAGGDICHGRSVCEIQVCLSHPSPCLPNSGVLILAGTSRMTCFDPAEQEKCS